MSQFTLATANTLLGGASRDMNNLSKTLQADILLLQEVINPQVDDLEKQLKQSGYKMVVAVGKFGLAIALRSRGGLTPVKGSIRTCSFGKLGWLEKLLIKIYAKQSHEFAERGMVAIKLASEQGNQLTVVNVHPGISFASKRIRRRQIRALTRELKNSYYDGPLLIAGDMNHYPGPEAVDLALLKSGQLTAIDLAGEPTWIACGSPYEKLIHIATVFNRKSIEAYNGQLDTILYRQPLLRAIKSEIVEIQSDHRAIKAFFEFAERQHSNSMPEYKIRA